MSEDADREETEAKPDLQEQNQEGDFAVCASERRPQLLGGVDADTTATVRGWLTSVVQTTARHYLVPESHFVNAPWSFLSTLSLSIHEEALLLMTAYEVWSCPNANWL